MVETQKLIIKNLDNLVEDVFGVGGDIFKPMSYEELEKKLLSSIYRVYPTHDHYFALFRLIHEQPKKAVKLLEKTAEYQHSNRAILSSTSDRLKSACNPKSSFVSSAKRLVLRDFLEQYPKAPDIWSWNIADLLAIVNYNSKKSLEFFLECYEQIEKEYKEDESWDSSEPQILTIIEALKTKNFDIQGQPDYLELKLTQKKERLELPKDINVKNPISMLRYFMQLEGISLKDIGSIKDKAILIPREGDSNWEKGLYIITYDSTGETDTIYKTEKPHTDEEIVEKTTGKGEIIKGTLEKVALNLLDIKTKD